jgi:CDP-diacylglycerol---serine O-phosphatidyltransferase
MSAMKIQTSEVMRPKDARFRKTIYLLPNLFTAANLVLGILAISMAINDSLTLSMYAETKVIPFVWPARLILIAILMDFLDGLVARATGTTSRFGMEFDSMADMVSFGVAPAILIYLSVLRYTTWGIFITVLYVVCAAVRLARFNVQAEIEEKDHFMGLPSPAAAGILTSYVLLSRWMGWYDKGIVLDKVMGWYQETINYWDLIVIPVITAVVALVMVSTIRYPSLKKWRNVTVNFRTLVLIPLVFFWLIKAAEPTSFLLLTAYLLWGLFRFITHKSVARLRRPKPTT